jgi:hypothetical protein
MYNGYPASKDHHDSWGTCTTSTQCKTIITVVLTVMSGMDPHIISGNLGCVLVMVKSWVRLCRSGLLDGGSVVVRLYDAIEVTRLIKE